MTRLSNPWKALPETAPFVVPQDAPFVEAFNRSASEATRIHDTLLPEPFFGDPNAPAVVLLLNPGYTAQEQAFHEDAKFQERLREGLDHDGAVRSHFHLESSAAGPGFTWWLRVCGPLVQAIDRPTVAAHLFAVQYFPYHSRTFAHAHLRLPSQSYSFDLVRSAIDRKAQIVCVRGYDLWVGAVPQLYAYPRLSRTKNPRNAMLSERNLASFSQVVRAIAAARHA